MLDHPLVVVLVEWSGQVGQCKGGQVTEEIKLEGSHWMNDFFQTRRMVDYNINW